MIVCKPPDYFALTMLLDGTNAGNSRRLTDKGRQQMDEVRRKVRDFLGTNL